MTKLQMQEALKCLDSYLTKDVTLLVGGGAALVLGFNYPLSTTDIDAMPIHTQMEMGELDSFIKKVANDLNIDKKWINTYFSSFTYVLPEDYSSRLHHIYEGSHLKAKALGAVDIIIMKCFAGRDKDIGHIKALLKRKNTDIKIINSHLQLCIERNYPKALNAADFFDDIRDQMGL